LNELLQGIAAGKVRSPAEMMSIASVKQQIDFTTHSPSQVFALARNIYGNRSPFR
jgi:hypothetical protein